MANPLKIVEPYVKKYFLQLYIGLGAAAYWKANKNIQVTYAKVYSRHDNERKSILEGINKH